MRLHDLHRIWLTWHGTWHTLGQAYDREVNLDLARAARTALGPRWRHRIGRVVTNMRRSRLDRWRRGDWLDNDEALHAWLILEHGAVDRGRKPPKGHL